MLGMTIDEDQWVDLTTSDGPVRVVLKKAASGKARLAIDAPPSVRILRSDLQAHAAPAPARARPTAPAARMVPQATVAARPLYQRARKGTR